MTKKETVAAEVKEEAVKPVEEVIAVVEMPAEEKPVETKAKTTKAKAPRAKAEAAPVVYVQYEGYDADTAELVEAARAKFREEKKRAHIDSFKLYIRPEIRTAFYVINEEFTGEINY